MASRHSQRQTTDMGLESLGQDRKGGEERKLRIIRKNFWYHQVWCLLKTVEQKLGNFGKELSSWEAKESTGLHIHSSGTKRLKSASDTKYRHTQSLSLTLYFKAPFWPGTGATNIAKDTQHFMKNVQSTTRATLLKNTSPAWPASISCTEITHLLYLGVHWGIIK